MPANEHLTMQIGKQIYGIETAENALIFFRDGSPAYLTKRFDTDDTGARRAVEDFASLAGKTPQTYGQNYKYQGSYWDLFILMKKYVPAYAVEAPKLFKLLIFNYLFSNGDAHFKNFSLIETPFGDFRLSPAYDLLNSRIHVNDADFALEDGLLPRNLAQGTVRQQFERLAEKAELNDKQITKIFEHLCTYQEQVAVLVSASYLNPRTQRNYLQAYQTRLKKLAS